MYTVFPRFSATPVYQYIIYHIELRRVKHDFQSLRNHSASPLCTELRHRVYWRRGISIPLGSGEDGVGMTAVSRTEGS